MGQGAGGRGGVDVHEQEEGDDECPGDVGLELAVGSFELLLAGAALVQAILVDLPHLRQQCE